MTRRPTASSRPAGPRRSRQSAPRRSRQSTLWRDRRFCVFLTSQTLSVAGDSFALIAVPLLILQATGSVAQMGLLTGAAGAAAVVAGIFAGILVNRLDRWVLMAACDLARMLLYGLIPLVWSIHPEVWLLYVILPLCAALGMVFQVGYVTVVPVLSGPGPDHRSQRTALRGLIDGRDRGSVAGWAGLRCARPGRCDRRGRRQLRGFGCWRPSGSPGSFHVPVGYAPIRPCPGAASRMAAPQCHP